MREELLSIRRYNTPLNAFVTVFSGPSGFAMSRARELDRRLADDGDRTAGAPLAGLPVTIKDNVFLGGFPTTNGSAFFREFLPPTNADVVDALLAAGCIPLGKTNLHELALGVTSTSAHGGPIRNPFDQSRISGGSSGGSAVSVARSHGAIASVGSDTGGSVRIPAAFCGVCGFKPSQGLLSTRGVFPLSPTLDHLGLLTKTMGDMSLVFEALTGIKRFTCGRLSVCVPSGYFTDGMDEEVTRNFSLALTKIMERSNVATREVNVRGEDYRRYSQARATITYKEGAWFYDELLRSEAARSEMHEDVRALMDVGLRKGMIEYMNAMNLRVLSVPAAGALLTDVDALVMPTCPVVAPKVDEVVGKETGPLRTLLLRNTELFNMCGFPALSVPMNAPGRSLPTAIQVVGRLGEDGRVMAVGEAIWSALHPDRGNR